MKKVVNWFVTYREDIKTVILGVLLILVILLFIINRFIFVMLIDIRDKSIEQEGNINYLLWELESDENELRYYHTHCNLEESLDETEDEGAKE